MASKGWYKDCYGLCGFDPHFSFWHQMEHKHWQSNYMRRGKKCLVFLLDDIFLEAANKELSVFSGCSCTHSHTTNNQSQAQSNISTLLYSPWEKNFMSKVSKKSEVLNLRYINVCQYCKYYLKYWSKGINGPLDPWGGQNFQCFLKWDGLTGRGGVYWRVQNDEFSLKKMTWVLQ